MKNIIFLDFLSVFYPHKNKFYSKKNNEPMVPSFLNGEIHNLRAEQIAVDYFNNLNQQNIEFVLIDSIISSESINDFHTLIEHNSIKLNLHSDFYFLNKNISARMNCSNTLKKINPNNYVFIAPTELKYNLELEDTLISFENSIFIDKDDGLSYQNILDLENTISKWY